MQYINTKAKERGKHMQQDKKQTKKQANKNNKQPDKIKSPKQIREEIKKTGKLPSYLEKRKNRFLAFWGIVLSLGFLSTSWFIIRLVHSNRIPANLQFAVSIIKVLDIFLLVFSPVYAALIYYSYMKGIVTTKKAFTIRFIFGIVLFIYAAVIFFGLR